MRKRQISMLDHVPNLPFHCNTEECYEIHDENWPKYRNIKHLKERAEQGDCRGFRYGIPELKFWQSSYERSKFFVTSRWQFWSILVVYYKKIIF